MTRLKVFGLNSLHCVVNYLFFRVSKWTENFFSQEFFCFPSENVNDALNASSDHGKQWPEELKVAEALRIFPKTCRNLDDLLIFSSLSTRNPDRIAKNGIIKARSYRRKRSNIRFFFTPKLANVRINYSRFNKLEKRAPNTQFLPFPLDHITHVTFCLPGKMNPGWVPRPNQFMVRRTPKTLIFHGQTWLRRVPTSVSTRAGINFGSVLSLYRRHTRSFRLFGEQRARDFTAWD